MTETELQRRIAALSPEKRAVLENRLAKLAAAHGPAPDDRITPRDRDRPTPLTFAQQREWATGRLRSANNISGALRLEGELDVALLGRVLTEIVERHEVLRSTVELRDRTPVQVVHPASPVPTPVVDLSDLAPGPRREEVRRLCDAEVTRPFDPAEPQRMRITLLRLAADTHVALFTTDHAASDAWSLAIVVQEFVALYGLHRGGGEGGLPLPEIQFGDFAAWQHERMGEERIAGELGYWKEALAGIPARLELPVDRPYPARPTYAGAQHRIDLSPELSAGLRRFTEAENVSLFMVLLAACSVLLYRYGEHDDLVIGSAISGRHRVETERLIGCFANLLPLRMRLAEGQTLREVVRQARETTAAAYDHQDLPFDRLIEELGLGREASQTPLVRMMINVLTAPPNTLAVPGLRISPEPMDIGPVSVDLTLFALPRGDTVQLQWQYSTEVFDKDTVVLLAEQFQQVLRQIVTTADTTVGQVELAVAPAAPVQAPTAAPAGGEPGFVELFQRRVALAPQAPAVIQGGAETSYGELNRDANRLARHLCALGVGRDTRVGILLERSPRLAVAILGVLKAGGVYVPLDPAYPPERLAFMLADAGARVLLTQETLAVSIAGTSVPYETVLVDGPLPSAAAEADLPGAPDPDSLAYVVYTSGSTGTPKGAMIEHHSLVTFARDVVERFGLGSGDRFLQFASPSFDVLVEELFPTWLAGGAVVIPTQRLLGGGGDLADLAERERLTVMELPTAYWHEWVRELDRLGRKLPESLRLVIIGGERVLPERLALWRRLGVPLMHVYGLTETTVSSTFFRLDPADQDRDWPNLPIGTPLPSAGLRVLDSRLRQVPAGATGELYIGGVSLARGYLGRPALTAHRFIADPDPTRPGQRLYRTGDIVRQRADGNLEFLTRADTQIKIRGFRVEPAEIESVLGRHPHIAESVVTVHEPAPGDKRLIAHVVPTPGTILDTTELRAFLERQLPAHLIPSAFVELDALPLTTNGKVDHAALPAPAAKRPTRSEQPATPRTPLQQQLTDIITAVIGIPDAGLHDNFFELGGDSIQAIQIVARAQEQGIRLAPLDLFEHPTVAQLAKVATAAPVVDAEQGPVTGPVPLVGPQRWFCAADFAEPHHWNVSTVLELRDTYEPDLLRAAVGHLLDHHDGLRQRFQLGGEQTRVRIALPGDKTPFEAFDLSGLGEADRTRRLSESAARLHSGLDLAVGPLVRFALFRLGADRPDLLAVVAHHLVADVVSLNILVEDLRTACAQLGAGEPVILPDKTTSWQSWARRLTAHAGTQPVQAQREYWSSLAARPAGALPVDTSEGVEANTVESARTVTVSLEPTQTEELLRTAPAELNCRIDDLLLAALSRSLSEWSGASRHVVDLVRHTRDKIFDDVDLTRTVGWLDTIHPVELVCDADSTPGTTLKIVKEALRTVPSDGIGWQLLRQGVDPVPPAPVELAFDYVGRPDELMPAAGGFAVTGEPFGAARSPRGRRPYAIDVQASVIDGRLTVQWCYSENLHRRETVAQLADRHLTELRAMLKHISQPAHTPSDFPLARVDQSQLDGLMSRISKERDAQ